MHFLGVDREPTGERSKSLLVAVTKSFTVGQPQEFSQMSALSAPSARPPRGVSRDRVSFNTHSLEGSSEAGLRLGARAGLPSIV